MSFRTEDIMRKIVQEVLEKKKRETKVFKDDFELTLFGSIISTILESENNLVIYEVSNFENLFEYSDLFTRLRNAGEITVGNKRVSVIPVTSFPHKTDIMENVEVSISNGAIPVVGYFVGDFIPSESHYHEVKELMELLTATLFERVCYTILFTTNQVVLYDNIPLARYGVVIEDLAPKIIAKEFPEKRKFADIVGYLKVVQMDTTKLAEYAKKRRLPTPHTIKYLERDVEFDDLVLTESIKDYIRFNIISPLKRDFFSIPSLLFIGPPGSGKTTLSYTIASAIGVPAYAIYVELMTSKWLGESEKLANQTMLLINDRAPVVAVFRDLELLIGGSKKIQSEESGVYERIRSIISTWIRSDRRRFLAIFTVSDPRRVPEYILQDATFGVYKLPILPPLTVSERRALLIGFLRKFSKESNLVFDPLRQSVSEALDTVAEETWAFTPRELMILSRIIIQMTREKGLREVTKDMIQTSKRYLDIDRIARVEIMLDAVKACRKVGIPESLAVEVYKFETEVEKLKAEAHAKEAKKKALVSIARE